MNVSIHPDVERFIQSRIDAGAYTDAEQAVNELLRYVSAQLQQETRSTEELRQLIAVGVAEADRGELTEWDDEAIWDEVERRFAEDQKKAG